MVFWFVLALMTGAAVLAVLWPLSATSVLGVLEPAGDVAFYTAQLAEIDRDRDRGLIRDDEAASARIESSRRLLRAANAPTAAVDVASEPALRRRRAASALALCVVPIVGLALYGLLGSPQALDLPARGRTAADPSGIAAAVREVEAHLAGEPDDLRGWDLIAPIYLRIGRYADAAAAFRRGRLLGGDTPDRLNGEGEALVGAEDGAVGAEARALFALALARDPSSPGARFHLALAADQDGDRATAEAGYRSLIAGAAPNAPWLPLVRARLAGLDGPGAASAGSPRLGSGAITPEIAAMVSGLDDRLVQGGGSEAEWSRLIRSLVVLGRREDATERYGRARAALAGDRAALQRLGALATELGLRAEVARQ